MTIDPEPKPAPNSSAASEVLEPPRFLSYVGLNLAVWAFLVIQAWLLTHFLGSARSLILVALLLALGFSAVSVFDYLWLRRGIGRNSEKPSSQ